ncbi:MAG: hypothetical protein IKA19_01660 [Muribaculaceae bacterium]|nr:hypothetical protein [Muribaculaceae bacterium]MBR1963393.1 hypothetical protein [Muribaculaceae bacterium]
MRKVVLKILLNAMIALMTVDALSQSSDWNYVMTIEPCKDIPQSPNGFRTTFYKIIL